MTTLELKSLDDTTRIARTLAEHVRPGDVIAMYGELGAGKTTFAQAFIHALLKKSEPVTSPTFTLTQTYESKHGWPLLHVDLYRVKHENELAELGLSEMFDNHVTLIEWPEMVEKMLPSSTLKMHFEHDSSRRSITFSTNAGRLGGVAKSLAA